MDYVEYIMAFIELRRLIILLDIQYNELRTLLDIGTLKGTYAAVIFNWRSQGRLPEVVAFTTGSKSNFPTNDPKKLHNFHAEILVRRAFIVFLQNQLKNYYEQCENSELKRKAEWFFEKDGSLLRLRKDIEVILYISKPPCGDGGSGSSFRNEGKLRVKYIDGEGTHPLDRSNLDRVTNISCSDRLLSWNIVGLQGPELSKYFATPIYIDTILCPGDLAPVKRAVYGRYKGKLPIQKPSVIRAPACREVKPKPYAIHWSLGHSFEKINTKTGLAQNYERDYSGNGMVYETASRLCRHNVKEENDYLISLGCKKDISKLWEYYERKRVLRNELKKCGYGDWNRIKRFKFYPFLMSHIGLPVRILRIILYIFVGFILLTVFLFVFVDQDAETSRGKVTFTKS